MKRIRTVRWTVIRDYYNDDIGDFCSDTWPTLCLSQGEAESVKARLADPERCDPSFYDPKDENCGTLYVDQITL